MIFSLARTVPGYQLLFRELFEVCTRKKHVRPLKTRAWNGSERENDEEEEGGGGERSGEAGCLKVPKRARKRDKGPAGIIDAGTRRETSGSDRGPRGSTWIEGGRRGSPARFHARNEDGRETESGSV